MYSDDDLSLLDDDAALESPLDQLAAVDDPSSVAAKPDVEEMFATLGIPRG